MAKKLISMKFEPEFLAEIDAAASRRGIDRTAFVEKALRRVLAGESVGQPAVHDVRPNLKGGK
jgi:metal-responsive CopG/Arc/MetJ family transcriptional regulator